MGKWTGAVITASLLMAACGAEVVEEDRNAALPVAEGVDQLALTVRTTCIALRDGEVRCRGESQVAQVGRVTPMVDTWQSVFPENGGPTIVSHGQGLHVCAAFGATVKCWGKNDARQVENSATAVVKDPGQAKVLPERVNELVTGVTSTCALLTNGAVWCWGSNSRGQIGPNGGVASAVPVEVPVGAGVADISSGRESVCVVTFGGRVICWGSDEMGILGDGPALTGSSQLREVTGYRGARSIELGARHACSVASTFDVWCWGDNSSFQNGSGGFSGVYWVPTRAVRNAQVEYRQVAVADH
ncbi:MAG: RCC1 domain-containing protein [Actinomycetota bacterium]